MIIMVVPLVIFIIETFVKKIEIVFCLKYVAPPHKCILYVENPYYQTWTLSPEHTKVIKASAPAIQKKGKKITTHIINPRNHNCCLIRKYLWLQ